MLYAVIYSVDVKEGQPFRPWMVHGKQWERTERINEGDDESWKHGKWCGILTEEQFEKFLRDKELVASDVRTLGSLGFPAIGISPAISFEPYCDFYYYNPQVIYKGAYVTPLPEVHKHGASMYYNIEDWERVRKDVINKYSDGV